ncbi:MAG: DUF1570 domain-containing protein [Planctomycetota bacterium]
MAFAVEVTRAVGRNQWAEAEGAGRRLGAAGHWGVVVGGAVVGLCFALASAAAGQVRLSELSAFESKAYVIHTNLSREEAMEYGVHMDLIYKEYSRRFRELRGASRKKQDMYLLRTRRDYIAAMAEFGIPAEASGGMFFWGGGTSGLATWVEGLTREQVFSTLQHEGFHQFAHTKMGGATELPLWVNEGLAEYFGSAIVVRGDVRTGIVDGDRVAKVNRALEEGRAIGFYELLNTTSRQWQSNMRSGSPKGSLQYDQSWAVVHFLIHGDRGKYRKAFGAYLMEISRGRNHEQAFTQTFGRDDARFARRWERFMGEVEPDHYSVALKRLQFLGEGLRFLAEAGGGASPTDLEALRKTLQERSFTLTWLTESGEKTLDSKDEALYGYEDRKGVAQRFELVPAEAESGLPAGVRASELSPTPTLAWTRDDGGNLRAQVTYARKR